MAICIHRSILGTVHHLVFNEGNYEWHRDIPPDAYVFGEYYHNSSLDIIMKFLKIDPPMIYDNSHIKTFKELGYQDLSEIPWHHILPARKFYGALQDIIERCQEALESLEDSSYCTILQKEHAFLVGLSRASIDKKRLSMYTAEEGNPTVLKTLSGFRPMDDGMCHQTRYDQLSTATGRLTVTEGPRILTLSKKYRDIIAPSTPAGIICQIDFVSLEPRVARKLSGKADAPDIYIDICKNVFESRLSRDEAKLAVLCALYGVSSRRLSNMLHADLRASSVIRKIHEYFGTFALLRNLNQQVKSTGHISNFFGRELMVENRADHVMLSHFIQSTAVDVALLGFHDLNTKLKERCTSFRGLFVVHDALVVDIDKDDYKDFENVVNEGIDVEELGNFPLSIDVINDGR